MSKVLLLGRWLGIERQIYKLLGAGNGVVGATEEPDRAHVPLEATAEQEAAEL